MKTRPFRTSDLPILESLAAQSGFPYADPRSLKVESIIVTVDENDQPICACAAHRMVEIYAWVDKTRHPAENYAALQALDSAMVRELRMKGYTSAECFVPPSIFKQFSRRLMRSFGWQSNWASLCKHF